MFLFSKFLKKFVTYDVLFEPATDEELSSFIDELLTVLVEGVLDATLIYFLKNSASSSTTISYLITFFCTGGGISSVYDRFTSIFNIESLNYNYNYCIKVMLSAPKGINIAY